MAPSRTVKLLVAERLLRSARATKSSKMLCYPSGMMVPARAPGVLSNTLRAHRNHRATRWRKLSAGSRAVLSWRLSA